MYTGKSFYQDKVFCLEKVAEVSVEIIECIGNSDIH